MLRQSFCVKWNNSNITTASEQFKMQDVKVLYLETTFKKIQDRICNE